MNVPKINNFFKKRNYLLYFFSLAIFFLLYSLGVSQIKSYNNSKRSNFNSFLDSNEFNNIKEYIFENLNSPYREFNYIVQNNDTIEKILKRYDIDNADINNIASKVIEKKLSNIFPGTKIKVVVKKDGSIK
jgi:hypothetical protein